MKSKLQSFFAKKENLYLVLALTFGLIMALFNPPFAGVPDEGAHYYRALGISRGDIFCNQNSKINKAAFELPGKLQPINVTDVDHKIIPLKKIKAALFEKDSREDIPFAGILCGANPLGYIPQALGFSVGNIFNMPALWGFYLARLCNLLVAVLITYYALKIIPFGKIIILVTALLPMTMQQYASLNYDALHISVILFFIAFTLKLATNPEQKMSKNEMFQLGFISILAANIKWGFMPIMLLLFALPIKIIGNRKKYFLYVFGVIALSLILFLIAQKTFIGEISGRSGVHTDQQLRNFFSNPFSFLAMVIDSLYIGCRFYFETFLYKSGWLTSSLSPIFYLSLLFGIIFLVRSEKEEVFLTTRQRLVIGLTFLASFLFVFFSLYLFWTKSVSSKIQGVQGRYLLSSFPLLLFAFYKSNFHFSAEWIRKNMAKVITGLVIIMFATVFYSLWFMYYR